MADNKKFVSEITSMDEDFTQWYTDVVIKAGLIQADERAGVARLSWRVSG